MFLSNYLNQKKQQRRAEIYTALIHHEAKLGGTLFGPIPKGHRREFFCFDERTWIWHEEFKNDLGNWQAVTTRYDVRANGVVKTQSDKEPEFVSGQELRNLYRAVKIYGRLVREEQDRMLAVM